ncbi:rod shape-determining protein MreC [Helicobacter mustelae]|uniref:Putative rod shape determining protein MreC n=1 Tax=Helicobacter mustelae (strain ATCC 43772 / CCUG 25715 / CIP 103759 / LMG 18044 / NCTC 12198 / R85-136P) TaxID=679897 RepID=D3UFP1_HELM1|nr:rod shape-determining protein MreC [Helicobacter mustelae]CBG39312.1 putative rod shape determining protein MreC [Helicobacter mustelae 12198]SQH70824.1 rod shape determining protein MreC [Helicobacter mustelae]STP11950.1 rod shape determining protein MreC [Helicobacter mustelae]
MRYKIWVFLLVCFCLSLLFFGFKTEVRKEIFTLTDPINVYYHNIAASLKNAYEKFFNQAEAIAFYKQKYDEYEMLLLQLKEKQNQIDELLSIYPQLDLFSKNIFIPAMVSSYVDFFQYDRVWLYTKNDYPSDGIFGIVRDGKALGIAVVQEGRLLGLFNGNEKCSYSVFIGAQKVPALVHFNPEEKGEILADFIPQNYEVHEGDEVVTSGLDGIFIQNIPVGKITKVMSSSGYITASIKAYASKRAPIFLFLIDRQQPTIKAQESWKK